MVIGKLKLPQKNSMTFVIGVAVLLLIGAFFVPMTTSLGQGVNERVATGWQGVLNPGTHDEYFRMNFSDGSFLQFPISGLSPKLFTQKTSDDYLATTTDLLAVVQVASKQDKKRLDRTLGTYGNAPSLFHPFSEEPIAYTASFLKDLAAQSINPKAYGGPNIPPGSVKVSQLPAGVLHIDTKADNNTLSQCAPGQIPLPLKGVVT